MQQLFILVDGGNYGSRHKTNGLSQSRVCVTRGEMAALLDGEMCG